MTPTLTDFDAARTAMIDSQLRPSDISNPNIIAAFARVAREDFVPDSAADFAYMDRPIPLAAGRSLNPPIATARLLMAAGDVHQAKVLVIGAATGYCATLLTELGADVVAVESNDVLAAQLAELTGMRTVHANLTHGAPAHMPYDVILIDGAVDHVPQHLIEQLRDGGSIVAGLIRGAVTQLARGVKTHGTVVLVPFADMEIVPLPGFDRPKIFEF